MEKLKRFGGLARLPKAKGALGYLHHQEQTHGRPDMVLLIGSAKPVKQEVRLGLVVVWDG